MSGVESDALPTGAQIRAAGDRIATRIVTTEHTTLSYTRDLALEALVSWSRATGDARWRDHVGAVLAARGCDPQHQPGWRLQPFACLTIAWAEATGDERWIPGLIAEGRRLREEIWRSTDGLVLHPRGESRGGGYAVLIDSAQEFIARCAWTAARSGEEAMADEAAEQAEKHRDLLRDPLTGMWSQGRGWIAQDTDRLSPGTWSRGQGWLMRGLGCAAAVLPKTWAAKARITAVFRQLADDVLARQGPSGLWHAVPNLPPQASGVETSGSGLIAAGMLAGTRAGLVDRRHREAGQKTVEALVPFVDAEGVVHQACYGPGPLMDLEPWLKPGFPPGDGHGVFAVLGALAGGLR